MPTPMNCFRCCQIKVASNFVVLPVAVKNNRGTTYFSAVAVCLFTLKLNVSMSTTSENNVVEEEAESRNATAEVDSRNGAAPSPTDGVARIHQLQNTWTLWFYKSDNSRKWEDNLREVIKFDTVEDFWGLFNHIIPPSSLVTVFTASFAFEQR